VEQRAEAEDKQSQQSSGKMQRTRKVSRAAEDEEDKESQRSSGKMQKTRRVSRTADRCRGQAKLADRCRG
jgi:hypothetical protein